MKYADPIENVSCTGVHIPPYYLLGVKSTSNQNFARFVCYFKIINIFFWKNNVVILK